MKIKFKNLICLLGVIGLILSASNLYAQPPGKHFPGYEAMREGRKARMLEIYKQLNLSPEQEKQLEAHRNKHRGQIKEFHKDIRAKREELRSELQKQELNMQKINQLHSELKDIHGKMADYRLEGILEVRKILTPEQFAKFIELTERRRSKMKGRHRPKMKMEHQPPESAED